jgi:AraC-like DNA-binding protein
MALPAPGGTIPVTGRRTQLREYDDGVNAWRMLRATARPDLDGIADYTVYCESTGGFTTRRELPHCEGVLIINLGDPVAMGLADGRWVEVGTGEGFAAGLHMAPVLSRSAGRQAGVHIHLGLPALGRVLRTDMPALTGEVVKLDALWGPAHRHLGEMLASANEDACRFDLLDQTMALRMADRPAPHTAIRWAARRLHRNPRTPISVLAAEIGWSRQYLSERFARALGCSPRSFARIARFERLIGALHENPRLRWSELAAAHGYADQPHLARDVAALAGVTPTALAASFLPAGGGILA